MNFDIRAADMSDEIRPFALQRLLDQLENRLGSSARSKGVVLFIETPTAVTVDLVGDELRLEQILLNLVGNAINFTEQGKIHVKVQPVEFTDTTTRLRFEVHDTGVGIPPEVQSTLFTPISKADGAGPGLSICKRLVELMKGTIGMESRVGVGSVFWFELPFHWTTDVTREVALLPPLTIPVPRKAASPLSHAAGDETAEVMSLDFPVISGIDSNKAALALANDRELFLEILQRFVAEYRDAMQQTRIDLTRGDRESAARRLHNLRGAAALLGAVELMQSCQAVEESIVTHRPDLDPRLKIFALQLSSLMNSSASWLHE